MNVFYSEGAIAGRRNEPRRSLVVYPPNGLPYAINNAVQIIQGPQYVALVYEMLHDTRVIPLDGSPHLASNVHLWNGDSRGHWEGKTLVVDTTNFNDQGSVTNSAATGHLLGIQQSEALHVVERFTRVGADTINYEVTIEDPGVYSGPWKVALPLSRDDDYKIFEYGCHEGNHYFMTAALGAGRAAERTSTEDRNRARPRKKRQPAFAASDTIAAIFTLFLRTQVLFASALSSAG